MLGSVSPWGSSYRDRTTFYGDNVGGLPECVYNVRIVPGVAKISRALPIVPNHLRLEYTRAKRQPPNELIRGTPTISEFDLVLHSRGVGRKVCLQTVHLGL